MSQEKQPQGQPSQEKPEQPTPPQTPPQEEKGRTGDGSETGTGKQGPGDTKAP